MQLREHYVHELALVHQELRVLGEAASTALAGAVAAFEAEDDVHAQAIIADDVRINAAQAALEHHVVVLLATQQPTARDLRHLIATLEVAAELERIGDYAKNVAGAVLRLGPNSHSLRSDLLPLANAALGMLAAALETLVNRDVLAARALASGDNRVDAIAGDLREHFMQALQDQPASAPFLVECLMIVHVLERVADRATNIGERVIFMETGELVELNP